MAVTVVPTTPVSRGHTMPESSIVATLGPRSDAPRLSAIVEHWASGRLDGPVALISRFDDAGRQLVGVGGLLQGAAGQMTNADADDDLSICEAFDITVPGPHSRT
jgi:hypothetical protein